MPYDPNSQYSQQQRDESRRRREEQQRMREAERQQREAEQIVANRQQEQEAAARAAQSAAFKAEQTQREHQFRAEGATTYTTADGVIHKDPLHDQKVAQQQQEAQVKAQKEEADRLAKEARAEAIRNGRRHQINPVDGRPIYLESEQDVEQRHRDEAEKLRRSSIDDQIKAAEAEYGYRKAQDEAAGLRPLSPAARRNLETKALPKAQQEALFGLQAHYQQAAGAVSGGNDWIPFNEKPTPEAETARQHLQRLQDPNATLTEEDLATLSANDATKPLVDKIQKLRGILTKDDELQKFHAEHGTRLADLTLRRDAPDKWAEMMRERRAGMTPEQLQASLQASQTDLTTRADAINQRASELNSAIGQHQSSLDALTQQAAERRATGIPAGEIVTYKLPDGTTEDWPRDLATERETTLAKLKDVQAQQAADWAALKVQQQEWNRDAALHNEATALQKQAAQASDASRFNSFRFIPGMGNAADELAALDSEAQTRLADLQAVHGDNVPPEAVQGIQQEMEQRAQNLLATRQQQFDAARAAAMDLKAFAGGLDAGGSPPNANDVAARRADILKNTSEALGMDPAELDRMIGDAESLDWSTYQPKHGETGPTALGAFKNIPWLSKLSEGTLSTEKGGVVEETIKGMIKDKDARQTRILSNGAVVVNPAITDEKEYNAAVEASQGSPEAKAAALDQYPKIREELGQQTLDAIDEIASVFGRETVADWDKFRGTKPAGVTDQDWAFQFAEKLKKDAKESPISSTVKEIMRSGAQGLYDLRQQAGGLAAGILPVGLGSETMMNDAAWASRKANAFELTKNLDGTSSENWLSRGLFSQLPRLAGSIIPAATGAGAMQGGLRAFAGTKLGARFFPALAAAIQKSASPSQAVKAVQTLTRAGLGGAAGAGALQTYGAQMADIVSILRQEHPELSYRQALQQAQTPAIASALATAGLTVLGGSHGVERLIASPSSARALFNKQFASRLQQMGFIGKEFLKGGLRESFLEEIPDEMFSQIMTAVGTGHSVQDAIVQFMQTLPELAVATTALGGLGEGVQAARESSVRSKSNLPETVAPAWTAIENHVARNAAGAIDEVLTDQQQRRAALALSLAQGGELRDVEAADLAAAGWTRDGDNFKPLKGYTGPQVFDVDKGGLPVIKDSYVASLRQTNLAPVADAIGMTETQTRNLNAQRNAAQTSQPSAVSQQSKPAGSGPASTRPVGNANQNTVPASAGKGTEPPRSRSTPAPDGSPVETEAPTTVEGVLANHLAERGMDREDAKAAAAQIVTRPEFEGMTYEQIIAEGPKFRAALDDLGITGSLHSKHSGTDPLRIQPGGRMAKVKEEMEAKAAAAKEKAAATADPFGEPDFADLREKVKAREVSDADAANQVADAVGATTHDAFVEAVVKHLGWKQARAEIAAHLRFGTKDESSIPLAAESRASDRAAPAEKPKEQPARHGPDVSLAADPSPLRKNRAYAAEKLRILAGIKDPAKKAWVRQFLIALEQSMQQHHLLYDAYAVGGPARRYLDGQMTSVLEVAGKITRLIDLEAMVAQFQHLPSPQDALRATGIEEDIHAQVLQLARENPREYGYGALRTKWKALPEKLKQTVWNTYRAANQKAESADKATMPKLTEVQEWHMMNEFLRMLVQDEAFMGQITETVDADPGFLGWVTDLLKNLSRILKDLMQGVSPNLRYNLQTMVREISARLKQIEQASKQEADRMAVLPSLRDPAGYARSVITSLGSQPNAGILSDKALARVFDQLDPALQSRIFNDRPAIESKRANKADLMRDLLSQFLGSRKQSRALHRALAGIFTPPKTTGLLTKIMDRLLNRVQEPSTLDLLAQQDKNARRNLNNLHIAILEAIGGIRAASFANDIGTKYEAVMSAPPVEPQDTESAARRKTDFLAALAAQEQDHEDARNDVGQAKLRERLRAEEAANPAIEAVDEEAERIQNRLADFLAALDERDSQIERDHQAAQSPAAGPALRRKLRQQELAAIHQIAYLRGEALAEIQMLIDRKRLPDASRRLLFDLMMVSTGKLTNYRPVDFKLAGFSLTRTLQNLGIRITERGGLVTTDPINTSAYVERGHIIIRQETLDTLADFYPAVAAYIRHRIGSEYDQRQKAGLPTFSPAPQVTEEEEPAPAPAAETAPEPPATELPAVANPVEEGVSPFAQQRQEAPAPAPAPAKTTARIPLGGKLSLPAEFATEEDLAAFQYQLDRDALLREGTPEKDRNAARDRITALRARLIDETGASKEEVEQKLADYHRAVIDAAKKADPVEVFRPVSFSNFLRARGTQTKADTLVAPEGGDLISALQGRVKRIGKISQSRNAGEWDWYRQLQQQVQAENAGRPLSRRQLQQALKAAQNGDVSTPINLLQWINLNIVDADKGMPLDEASAILSDNGTLDENDPNAEQAFDVDATSLGDAILAAIDARVTLRDQGGDPALKQEQRTLRQAGDFRAVAEGASGKPFTGRELADKVQTGDELQLGSEWLTVTDVDTEEGTVALDSDRYGPQSLDPSQTIHLLAIGDETFPASQSPSLPASKSPSLDEARAELRAALLEAGIQPLSASNRLTTEEKQRVIASIYAHNEAEGSGTRISSEYQGGNAWFTPDNRYFHAEQHWFMLPDDADYTKAMQAGFVRLSLERGAGKTLWAEFYPPLSTKKIERLRTEALIQGAELQLDPDRTQTLAASQRLSDRLTPAIRINGVLYTDGVTHWDIMESYVWRHKIPAWQRNETEDRQLARDWIEKNWKDFHPTVEEGFAEDGKFLSREVAFKKLLRSPEGPALKQYVLDSGGAGRTWLDSGDLDYLAGLPQSPRLPVSASPPLASSPRIRAAAATYADRAFAERGKRTFPDFLAFVAGDLPDFFPYLKTPHLRSAWNTLMAEKGLPEVTAAEEATALRPYTPKVERRFGEPPPDLARKLAAINEDDMGFPISVNPVNAVNTVPTPAANSEPATENGQIDFWGTSYDDYRLETRPVPEGSPMTANAIKAIAPYLISGNKGDLLGRHGTFYINLVRKAEVVLDAFGGGAIYTHFLAQQGALPAGSTWNEWEYSRSITNRQIKEQPEEVIRELIALREAFDAQFPVTAIQPTHEATMEQRRKIHAWINQKLDEYIPVAPRDEAGRLPLPDTPRTAALYLFLQNNMSENRVVDFDLDIEGNPRTFTGGKMNGKDDFSFIYWDNPTQSMQTNRPSRVWSDEMPALIRAASARFAEATIRQGDGWQLAADAPAGSLVFVDTSYFPTDEQTAAGAAVMNYSNTTLGDANPALWFQKFENYLLPKGNDVRYVVTNNFNGRVVDQLEKAGWTVLRTFRGSPKKPSHEFIALSPAAAADIQSRIPAAPERTFGPGGIPLGNGSFQAESGGTETSQRGLPAGEQGQTRVGDSQSGIYTPALTTTLARAPGQAADRVDAARISRELDDDIRDAKEAEDALNNSLPPDLRDEDLADLEQQLLDAAAQFLDDGDEEMLKAASRTADPRVMDALFAAPRVEPREVEPGFYSKLEHVVTTKLPARSSPGQILGLIKNAGIKQEEIKWSGLLPWLKDNTHNGTVSKDALLEHLRTNGAVKFTTTTLRLPSPELLQKREELLQKRRAIYDARQQIRDDVEAGRIDHAEARKRTQQLNRQVIASDEALAALPIPVPPRNDRNDLVLPGGSNPQEVVITWNQPNTVNPDSPISVAMNEDGDYIATSQDGTFTQRITGPMTPERAQIVAEHLRAQRLKKRVRQTTSPNYDSDTTHYGDLDALAWYRAADHGDGLFVEEFQSKWHQRGREEGYITDPLPPDFTIEKTEFGQYKLYRQGSPELGRVLLGTFSSEQQAHHSARHSLGAIPDAPYRQTDEWALMLFKRALRHAVEAGKKWIGWTNGETQADRYDLSRQITKIVVSKSTKEGEYKVRAHSHGMQVIDERASAEKLPDLIGKELAKKAIEQLEIPVSDEELTKVTGSRIKGSTVIHRDGSESRYDNPEVARASVMRDYNIDTHGTDDFQQVTIFKDTDLKVGGEGMRQFYDKMLVKAFGKYVAPWGGKVTQDNSHKEVNTPFWKVDITDAMRESVKAGQPLFAAPRRAREAMSFNPPFHTSFGDILTYKWMSQPVGGLESKRISDWNAARTNPATGREIVHLFKVRKPDGTHTVSLETALGQLTEKQRGEIRARIRSELQRRQEAATGQMTLALAAAPRVEPREVEPGFYSALAEAIRAKMPARGTPAQILGILKNAGLKAEEMKWTGIVPWLQAQAQDGPITQQQVLDYLATEGNVKFTITRLNNISADEDAEQSRLHDRYRELTDQMADLRRQREEGILTPSEASRELARISAERSTLDDRLNDLKRRIQSDQTRNTQWTLPGGTTPKEVVVTWNQSTRTDADWKILSDTSGASDPETLARREAAKQRIATNARQTPNSDSDRTHYGDLDALAWYRTTDRTNAAGNGLLVEEFQSKWHQMGREQGYNEPPKPTYTVEDANGRIRRFDTLAEAEAYAATVDEPDLREGFNPTRPGPIPDAPYRASWPLMLFKRALLDAVQSGKQWIGWTTGDTQADRYDLSKRIDAISVRNDKEGTYEVTATQDGKRIIHERDLSPAKLAETIGKELAAKAIERLQNGGVDAAEKNRYEQDWQKLTAAREKLLNAERDQFGSNMFLVRPGQSGDWEVYTPESENRRENVVSRGHTSERRAWLGVPDYMSGFYRRATGAIQEALTQYQTAYNVLWRSHENNQITPDATTEWATFSGLDLKVGGDGMRKFYDDILVKEFGKYAKQLGGGTVETSTVYTGPAKPEYAPLGFQVRPIGNQFGVFRPGNTRPENPLHATEADANAYIERIEQRRQTINQDYKIPIHLIRITPAMREAVNAGQALFAAERFPLVKPDARGRGTVTMEGDTPYYAGLSDAEWTDWAHEADAIKDLLSASPNPRPLDSTGQPLTPKQQRQLRQIGRTIQQAASYNRVINPDLYRGDTEFTAGEMQERYPVGKSITLPTLTSTSVLRHVANDYATNLGEGTPVFITLHNPHGHIGVQTAPLGVPSAEVVLPRGARYRVTQNKRKSDGIHIRLESDRNHLQYAAYPSVNALAASSRLPVAPQLDLRYISTDGQDPESRARSNPLQENHLGGGAGANAQNPRQLPTETSQLLPWAQAQGWLIDPDDLDRRLGIMQEIPSGDEHDVWHDELTDRAVKVTNLVNKKPFFVAGSPAAYALNLKHQNTLFDTGVTFEGIVEDEGQPRIVTSMPWIPGTAAEQKAKEAYFKAHGFDPAGPDTFYSMGRDLLVSDARPVNVLQRPDGTVQPIDIQVRAISPRQSEMWENRVNAYAKGLAASNRTPTQAIEATGLAPAISVHGKAYTGRAGMTHGTILGDYVWRNVFTPQQRRDDPNQDNAVNFAYDPWMDTPGSGFDDFGFLDTRSGKFLNREEAYTLLKQRGFSTPPGSYSTTNESLDSYDLFNIQPVNPVNPVTEVTLPAAQRVAAAASQTDPNPTPAQKRAGNYAKGKVDLHGLRISIENPAGSVRSGTDAAGKPWSITLPHHYGYILGSEGRDGDHVDVFIGPNPDSQLVLIINQRKTGNGHFDEHKIMLGFDSPSAAARGYLASYTPGWKGLQSAVATTIPVLKHWIENHDTTQPVTKEQLEKLAKTVPLPTSPHDQSPVTEVNPVNPVPLTSAEVADQIVNDPTTDEWLDTYTGNGWEDAEREFPGGAAKIAALLNRLAPRKHTAPLYRGINPIFGEVQGRPFYSYSFSRESAQMAGREITIKNGPTPYLSLEDIALARIRRDGRSHYAGMQQEVLVPSSPRLPVSPSPSLPASSRLKNTAKGATIGGGIGAGAGALVAGAPGAAIGGAVGTAIGAAAPNAREIAKAAQALDRKLLTVPGASKSLDLAGRATAITGTAITKSASAVASGTERTLQVANTLTDALGIQQPLATFGSNNLDKKIAAQLDKLAGPKIRSVKTAVETWLDKPDGLAPSIKGLVDQVLPNALLPREWLALHHEMQRKTAYGAETANDLIRALSGNPRLSDLAYPPGFAENPAARAQLFDAMEGRIPMSTLPEPMQRLGARLRDLLRQTGSELVRQGLMNPDTFEELQSTGWMPRYTEDEAREAGGSFLAAFKLGVRDLLQQRSTAYHIVDTSRRDKTGQFVTVSRDEGGKRNRWRFRDAATRDAFYHTLIRQHALAALQEDNKHPHTKALLDAVDPKTRREVRADIKKLTLEEMENTAKVSPALARLIKSAVKNQADRFLPKDPFEPAKLVKDPVYAVARYVLGQTHNASTMELLRKTAANPDWVSDTSVTGFEAIPDASRFGPLAGKYVRKDIARQILDLVDVPNAALQFYDAILRKWKAGKLVWNPGSHIRDAVGNTMFAYLGGSSIWNPGNWPYYQQAIAALRSGGSDFGELVEQQVIGGDAYSGLVKDRLKGLLPDPKTIEDYNPGLIQRLLFGFGGTLTGSHEFLASLRRLPDDVFKAAAYFKAKGQGLSATEAAAHTRKWFPYYDRLGQSGATRAAGRFVNPFLAFLRESTRILGTAVVERPLALTASLAFPQLVTAISAMILGLDDDDLEQVKKDLAGKGKFLFPDTPLFSMLLPLRSAQGALQQFDISAIMPFADLLGTRIAVSDDTEDPWNRFWRGVVAGGPVLSLIDAWRHNEDAFTRRPIAEYGMTPLEKIKAYAKHAAGVALPPLAPGGTAFSTLTRAGTRTTNKTLETYDPGQAVLRAVAGLNVKNATPNLYRLADDWRKANGYEVTEGMDYGSTTPASRARKALFAQLAQDKPNVTAIRNILRSLATMGHPVRTQQDIDRLLRYRDPLQLIGGNKARGITASTAQAQFRASLQGEARAALERALQEFQRIKAIAPSLIRQAQ